MISSLLFDTIILNKNSFSDNNFPLKNMYVKNKRRENVNIYEINALKHEN
jgi:hypothetical protein